MAVANMKTFVLAVVKPLICSLRMFYDTHISSLTEEIRTEKVKVDNLSQQVSEFSNQITEVMSSPVVTVTAESLQNMQVNIAQILETIAQLQAQVNTIDQRLNH